MNKGLKLGVTLLGLFLITLGKAQSAEEYFQRINDNYNGLESFQLELNYQLFKGHNGTEVKDQYRSTFCVNGQKSHRKLYDDEIITSGETSLLLNHQFKTIQVLPGLTTGIFDQNVTENLKHCQDVKFKNTEKGTLLTITFKQFSSIPYGRIDVLVDSDYWVKHMTLYYATQINYSRDFYHPDMDYSRLEVTYEKLTKGWDDKQGLTDISKYVVQGDQGYEPTTLYQNYQIIQ